MQDPGFGLAVVLTIFVIFVFVVMAINIAKIKDMFIDMRFEQVKLRKGIKDGDLWICPLCKTSNKATHNKCSNNKCKYDMLTYKF